MRAMREEERRAEERRLARVRAEEARKRSRAQKAEAASTGRGRCVVAPKGRKILEELAL
jgi:hypothetical protein